MIRKLLKILLLLVLVFGAVWLFAIIYWQATGFNPGTFDLAMYLLVVPVALIAAFLALTKSIEFAKERAAGSSDDDNDPASASAGDSADYGPEDDRTISLIDAAIQLPIGADVAETLAALTDGNTRPGLDDELVDAQGYPVFAARVPDLVDDEIEDELGLPAEADDGTPLFWSTDQQRALALAGRALEQIAGGPLAQASTSDDDQESTESRQKVADSPIDSQISLRLAVCLPPEWPELYRLAVLNWIEKHLKDTEIELPPIKAEVLVAGDDARALTYIDQWSQGLHRQAVEGLCLMLACGSAISDEQVTRWDSENRLFSQANPSGTIPAEGAAALLFSSDALATRLAVEPRAVVHRAAFGKRETSLKAKGRISGEVLAQLSRRARSLSDHAPEDIGCILTDSGVNSAHGVECGAVINEGFAHLDVASQCLNVVAACGALGTTATLAALAMAGTQADAEAQPVVVLGLQHEFDRAALIIEKYQVPDAERSEEDAASDNSNQQNAVA